jgi:8-oxo-dGTP diphosphatase
LRRMQIHYPAQSHFVRKDREYPAHPLVGVGALIHDLEGRVLLIKRRFEPNEGRWSLPGGLLETGERLIDAGRREVREELGVEIEVEELFHVSEDLEGETRFHFILVDFLATLKPEGASITLNEESEAFMWYAPSQVEPLETTENTRRIVEKYLREKIQGQSQH